MTRSLTTLPNNSTTPQTTQVFTSTGVNAGDLVYLQGSTGNYISAGSIPLPSSATFSAATSVPVGTNISGTNVKNSNPTKYSGGSAGGKAAAVLTNGNIVQVWMSGVAATLGRPFFQIVTPANVLSVAATQISATYTNSQYSSIGVLALTGGGFVAYWNNYDGGTGNSMNYAVYTNTGTLTTAATQDSGSLNTMRGLQVVPNGVALSGGGFVLGYVNSSDTISYRAYGATGIAAFAWATLTSSSVSGFTISFGLAARNDNSFLVCARSATANRVQYSIVNGTTGAAIVASTNFATTSGTTINSVDATTLADGTTFVVGYSVVVGGTYYVPAFVFIPTGNTVSSESYTPLANIPFSNSGGIVNKIRVQGLGAGGSTAGGFIYIVSSYYSIVQYMVFNASGVCISGTSGSTSNAALPIAISGSYLTGANEPSALEITGFINMYWSSDFNAATRIGSSQNLTQISETTFIYSPVNVSPYTSSSSATGTPTAVALTATTPTKAAFTSAGFSSAVSTAAAGTVVVAPTRITSTGTCNNMDSTTLPNGNILFVYTLSTTSSSAFISEYTAAGVFVQTVTLSMNTATVNTASITSSGLKIAALSSGKIAVAVINSTTIYCYLYSSSYVQIGSAVGYNLYSTFGTYAFDLAALTNDRYVLAYAGPSTYPYYAVLDNTNTQLANTALDTIGINIPSVVGLSNGGFAVNGVSGSSSYSWFIDSSGSSSYIKNPTSLAVAGVTGPLANLSLAASPNNVLYPMAYFSGAYGYSVPYTTTGTMAYLTNVAINVGFTQSYSNIAIGTTGYGNPVLFGSNASGVMAISAGITTGYWAPSTTLSSSFAPYVTGGGAMCCVTPGYGHNVVLSYIDSSRYAVFAIVTALSVTEVVTISGSTASTPIPIYPAATTTSPVIANTVFTGVAVATASANNTVQVQTNGLAKLNANYSTSTPFQAFDSTGLAVNGVRGTIVGNQVNMQGNS